MNGRSRYPWFGGSALLPIREAPGRDAGATGGDTSTSAKLHSVCLHAVADRDVASALLRDVSNGKLRLAGMGWKAVTEP